MEVNYTERLGITQDFKAALRWFYKAGVQGLPEAQHQLGSAYHEGQGVAQDIPESFKWYRKAAEAGYPPAQHSVGWCYATGTGVAADLLEAEKWYRRAAEAGHQFSQNNLGVMYIQGQGVQRDPVEAFKWFSKSAEPSAMSPPSSISGSVSILARAPRRTPLRQSIGSPKRRSRMRVNPSISWARCIVWAAACPSILSRLTNGSIWPPPKRTPARSSAAQRSPTK